MAGLATRQHGVVARWQLSLMPLTRSGIEHRLRAGRLHIVRRGVYAVGHTRLTERGRWMAAVLAFGPDALLSHRSCAALRSLLPDARAVIDVTVTGRTRKGLPGVRLHLPRALDPDDVDVHVMPTGQVEPPRYSDISQFRYRDTSKIRGHIERAYEASREYLDAVARGAA